MKNSSPKSRFDYVFSFSMDSPDFDRKVFVQSLIKFDKSFDFKIVEVKIYGEKGKLLPRNNRYLRVYTQALKEIKERIAIEKVEMFQ